MVENEKNIKFCHNLVRGKKHILSRLPLTIGNNNFDKTFLVLPLEKVKKWTFLENHVTNNFKKISGYSALCIQVKFYRLFLQASKFLH